MFIGNRKTGRAQPLKIIGATLVSTPIARATLADASSISHIEAVSATRALTRATSNYELVRWESVDHHFTDAVLDPAQSSPQGLRPEPNLFQYNSAMDLYDQLDTLLKEKSMLIAIV